MEASDSCCTSQQEKDAADAARFGLPDPSELDDDPVLAGCCAEDLQNMRKAEALRQALLDVDRSTTRLKLQSQALHVWSPQGTQLPDEAPLDSDEDGDDSVLAELRQRRLAEMQRQAAERQQPVQKGYGTLHDVASGALLDQVELLEGPLVAHLAVAGCEAGALVDEHLTSLAHRHRGTFFARVAVKRGDPLTARLRLEGLPGLVCFRSGAVVGRAPVSQFGPPGCLVEEEVTSYLQRLRVLRDGKRAGQGGRMGSGQVAAGGRSAASTGNSEAEDEDEEEEEWKLKPCDVCGRRYPHEHVRAVYGTCRRQSGSGSGDDEL